MKLNIDKDLCIGCGSCVAQSEVDGENLIEFDENGLATPVKEFYSKEKEEFLDNLVNVCPVDAISIEK